MKDKKDIKVLVGLSGGVDSAIACYLLKKEGYQVTGGFMRNWDAIANGDFLGNPTLNESQCPQEKDYEDACKVAEILGIELLRADFVKEYWDEVFTYFLEEYKKGRTPNPDIFCNKYIKFDKFLKFAKDNGFDYIATGHYAKRVDVNENYVEMHKSFDQNKDQTYFLSQVSQSQLQTCLFPLGDIDKTEVRRLAHELNLNIADKKDSTGVCFIGERNFKEFLKNYLPSKPGKMVTVDGKIMGEHDGIMYYTIGQRHGLGIGGDGDPWFVIGKNLKDNTLLVGQGKNNELLYSNRIITSNVNFFNEPPVDGAEITAKFRYRSKDVPVKIKWLDKDKLEVRTLEPAWAVTPGQACVFYDGEYCLGGSIIDEVYMDDVKRMY